MKWFLIGYVAGLVSMYALAEYLLFKTSQRFHRALKVELTWRKYFTGYD
jgi:hypothetical protein